MNTKNERLFVSDDLAMELAGKGFNEPCMVCYNQNYEPFMTIMGFGKRAISIKEVRDLESPHLPAPSYQQVVDFFRDIHNIEVGSSYVKSAKCWISSVDFISDEELDYTPEKFDNYYSALEASINKALELIK